MSKLPIINAIEKVNQLFLYESLNKVELLDILKKLEKLEMQRIIDAYNQGRNDCQHEKPIKHYNAEKYYEHLRNLH